MTDLDRLLKLRVIIARLGEMDLMKWWNTQGQLGPLGTLAVGRGLPRTHYFAQARSVFAVAAQRCTEIFDPPGSVTLWRLPATVEEEFDAQWERWLDDMPGWTTFFQKVEGLQGHDVTGALRSLDLVDDQDLEGLQRLQRTAEGRAVPIPGTYSGTDRDLALLALGFAKSEVGALAVPFMRAKEE